MSDDVVIKFSADVSDLQSGMQQAANTLETTLGVLRNGAAQIDTSFGSLTQAYAARSSERATSVHAASPSELAVARQRDQGQHDVAQNTVKEQASLVRQQAQQAQISRQEELTSLLALEKQREDIERNHLQFLAATYQQGTTAYATTQRRLEELTSQSALRRREIERRVGTEIYQDYAHSFEKVGSSVSSSIMGLIQHTMTWRDAARTIILQIVQSFVQARVKMVADWLAGIAANTAATQAGEAHKTAAVVAGTAARTGLVGSAASAEQGLVIPGILKSIFASGAEAFAGIFGFLSPIMGPAAAGPAAAGQAAVLGVAGGLAVGAWELPRDMIVQAHKGEMVVPAGVTPWAQGVLSAGGAAQGQGGNSVNMRHSTNINVNAVDAQSVKEFFKNNDRMIMRMVNEGVRLGAHLGLSKLR